MSKTGLVWTIAMGMAVWTCGCAHNSESAESTYAFKPVPLVNRYFTVEGIPQKKYMVGGGIMVYFEAPAEGTLYWVEETGRKIIRMEAVESGEVFSEELPLHDEDFQRLFADMRKTRFTVYFIPSVPAAD